METRHMSHLWSRTWVTFVTNICHPWIKTNKNKRLLHDEYNSFVSLLRHKQSIDNERVRKNAITDRCSQRRDEEVWLHIDLTDVTVSLAAVLVGHPVLGSQHHARLIRADGGLPGGPHTRGLVNHLSVSPLEETVFVLVLSTDPQTGCPWKSFHTKKKEDFFTLLIECYSSHTTFNSLHPGYILNNSVRRCIDY